MPASIAASVALDQAYELAQLRRENARLKAELHEAEVACGDFLKPYDGLIGAINNLRQIAILSAELGR